MQIVIEIPEIQKKMIDAFVELPPQVENDLISAIRHGVPLPEHHGDLKDVDKIVKAIEDRVEFLRKNDAIFMRLRKDIDILGCIPKIRCEVPTIIPATENEFFNFDAPIIKKQIATKEEKQNCEECAKWTDDCEESFFFGNKYCDGKSATKEGAE